MRRVLVTGSRDWDDPGVIARALREEYDKGLFVLVHGAAEGADQMSDDVVRFFADGCQIEAHPVQWRPYGIYNPHAGKARNSEMVALGADVCLAFIKNGSPGATDCADKAERAGIPVKRFLA